MKYFKVSFSEFNPVYDIEVEAENKIEALNIAREEICRRDIGDFEIWNVEEAKEKKTKG